MDELLCQTGPWSCAVAVPSTQQPDGFTFRYVMPFTLEERPITLTYGTATARRRPGVPLRFEPIEVIRPTAPSPP
jgi:hypothetical protein